MPSTRWPNVSPPRNGSEAVPDMPTGLTLRHDGAVLRLRLNRPERRDSLTEPIIYALTDTVDAAASDESVRVIHLEGEGEHFSSGFDLAERTPGPDRPRVGSVHRRMNGQVNRLIPAMMQPAQTPIVCTARGSGHRPGTRHPARHGLRRGDGRRPALGSLHDLPRSRPTVAPAGSCPVSRAWPGPARCSCWARRSRERMPPRGGWSPRACPAADLDAVSKELVDRLAAAPTVAVGLTKLLLHRASHLGPQQPPG